MAKPKKRRGKRRKSRPVKTADIILALGALLTGIAALITAVR